MYICFHHFLHHLLAIPLPFIHHHQLFSSSNLAQSAKMPAMPSAWERVTHGAIHGWQFDSSKSGWVSHGFTSCRQNGICHCNFLKHFFRQSGPAIPVRTQLGVAWSCVRFARIWIYLAARPAPKREPTGWGIPVSRFESNHETSTSSHEASNKTWTWPPSSWQLVPKPMDSPSRVVLYEVVPPLEEELRWLTAS